MSPFPTKKGEGKGDESEKEKGEER